MAPKSSTIAKAARNILRDAGTLLPNRDITARAKAISVAIGIPQPAELGSLKLKQKNKKAGNSIPPTAAKTGMAAFLNVDSSPSISSRLISKPTNKKKMVINPSLIHNRLE